MTDLTVHLTKQMKSFNLYCCLVTAAKLLSVEKPEEKL